MKNKAIAAVSGVKNSGKTTLMEKLIRVLTGRGLLVRQTQGVCERDFFQAFPEADVILLEGFKDGPYPKIEVVRAGNSTAPVCDPRTLLAVATDLPLSLDGIPVLGLDDVEVIADLILEQRR